MSFSSRLKELIKEQNLSQARFAEEVGITRARLNNYTKGRSEPDYATLVRIARRLDVSTDNLLGCETPHGAQGPRIRNGTPEFLSGEQPPSGDEHSWIPLYVARPRLPEDNAPPRPRGWLKVESDNRNEVAFKRPYALLIEDDSMPGELLAGDIVYIQPSFFTHSFLITAPFKELFAVRMTAADTIGISLKRCYVKDNMLICVADNPDYEPVILDMNRTLFVPLVGTISGVWRSYKGRNLQDSDPVAGEEL